MAEWFASGRLVDLILALVVVEVIALALYWRATRRGVPLADLLPNILAGAFLLLALRLSLGGFGWQPCCACLAAAGVAHLVDLRRRWM
ncbi:MAG: hypothetical protein ABWY82_02855 [Tardiphaga sp.]